MKIPIECRKIGSRDTHKTSCGDYAQSVAANCGDFCGDREYKSVILQAYR